MRSLVLASWLAWCLGCGPSPRDACVASQWSLRIDDPDVGHLCEMAVAPDETIVLLTGGRTLSLVEVEPDGAGWRRVELPPPAGLDGWGSCGHLAIAPDGERWATMGLYDDRQQLHIAIARVPVEGEPTTTLLEHPEATEWAPTRLAFAGDVLRVAGRSTTGTATDDGADSSVFFGTIDRQTAALAVQQEVPDLAFVHDLVPRAAKRLVALVTPPAIDYSDGYLLAVDLDRGEVAWQHRIENQITRSLGDVASARGVDDADVVVGRLLRQATTIERHDSSGALVWQHERSWHGGIASHHVAVGSRIVALVSLFEPGAPPQTTHVEVLGLDGEPLCTAQPSLPWSSARRALATRSGDAVIVADDTRPEQEQRGLWVTAIGVLERE